MITFLAFIYGTALGSFANLVADRLRVKTVFKGRSMCLNCGKKLTWKELFPIISYVAQKGKCRGCDTKISETYFWSEVSLGLLIAMLPTVILTYIDIYSSSHNFLYAIYLFVTISIVMALSWTIIVYDMKHMIVPFEIVMIMIIVGLANTVVRQYIYGFSIYDFFAGALVAAPFTLLYIFSKGKWVGMGDVMLYAAVGFVFGLPIGVTTFFYSIWLGAFVSTILILLNKREYNLKSEIPFTPFIIIGAVLAFYSHADLLGLYDMLY